MNITFLIGNGFDVNLGLNSKYTDFYPYYIESTKDLDDDNIIKKFSSKIKDNYETWGDFESAFAKNACGTAENVRDILYDFSSKFAQYLKTQTELCDYSNDENLSKFRYFLINGHNYLEDKHTQIISSIYNNANENITVNFVNFNYTDTLTRLIYSYKSKHNIDVLRDFIYNSHKLKESFGETLHIHGALGGNIIIGTSSKDQFSDDNLKNDPAVAKYCVKSAVNNYIGKAVIEEKFKEMINSSRIIYSYGLSFGESDKSRWDVISNWIRKDQSHKLVIYKLGTGFEKYNRAYLPLLYDAIDDCRKSYLSVLGFNEDELAKYLDQIFVIDSSNVLDFKLIDTKSKATDKDKEINSVKV